MRKKLCSILLVLALLATTFAGCQSTPAHNSKLEDSTAKTDGSSQGGQSPATSDTINFDEESYEVNFLYLVAQEGANQKKVEQAVSDLAKQELNMTVKLIPLTFGTYFSQISMMLAANESLDLSRRSPISFQPILNPSISLTVRIIWRKRETLSMYWERTTPLHPISATF